VGHPLDSQTMSPDLPVAFDGDFRSARYEQESLFMANFELGVVVIVDTSIYEKATVPRYAFYRYAHNPKGTSYAPPCGRGDLVPPGSNSKCGLMKPSSILENRVPASSAVAFINWLNAPRAVRWLDSA
jgi:hypothetical protein